MNRRIVLGMGAGHCGLPLLAEILCKQPGTLVTHEQRPWLSWETQPGAPGIRVRLERILGSTKERRVGDVASFYLPYVAEAIAFAPDIRIVCLRRPRNEVVAAFCRTLDQSSQLAINHWAKTPAVGWYHDPFTTRLFPQYDTPDREDGIRRYWDEYYNRVEYLVHRYPQNVRVWDADALTTDEGLREILTSVGIPRAEQVLPASGQLALDASAPAEAGSSPGPAPAHSPLDPKKCVILVPYSGFIHQDCENGLRELERRGYAVWRVGGYAAIDVGRSQMATDALRAGFEETMWIDSDIVFEPDAVERLRSYALPIVCGIYSKKGHRSLACEVMPGTKGFTLGQNGGLVELYYAATGFLLVRREVYLKIQYQLRLPVCNERFGQEQIPFFQSLIRTIEDGYWYMADDFAFCQRARECGFRIFADTTIRLWHIGPYRNGWEDAGVELQRYATFTLNLGEQPGPARGVGSESSPQNGEDRVPARRERMEDGDRQRAARELAARFPWPREKPTVPAAPERNWLLPATRNLLTRAVSANTLLIVELGSWTGRSTRFLADLAPKAAVVAVDHWEGSVEHMQDPELVAMLPRLFETFLAECWNYRERIIPLRARTVDGLRQVAEAGLSPDLVYIDADHRFESVMADLRTALDLFPKAAIVGDDWDWEGVRAAVETVARQRNLRFEAEGSAWRLVVG